VLDLPALFEEPKVFGLICGVMLDEEAFEPLHIVRQCVDVEHAWIIRVALLHTRVIRAQLFDRSS
jgi:hypothetical protein